MNEYFIVVVIKGWISVLTLKGLIRWFRNIFCSFWSSALTTPAGKVWACFKGHWWSPSFVQFLTISNIGLILLFWMLRWQRRVPPSIPVHFNFLSLLSVLPCWWWGLPFPFLYRCAWRCSCCGEYPAGVMTWQTGWSFSIWFLRCSRWSCWWVVRLSPRIGLIACAAQRHRRKWGCSLRRNWRCF